MAFSKVKNFAHFIKIEQENLNETMVKLKEGCGLLSSLDSLFDFLSDIEIKKQTEEIPWFLFMNVKREFYLSMASVLRLHQAPAYRSLRAAIDNTLLAIYLLRKPEKIKLYLKRIKEPENKEWKRVFGSIKNTINREKRGFSEVQPLLGRHKICSISAHADPIDIMQRHSKSREEKMLICKFFNYEKSEDDYNKELATLLDTFFMIYLIFWENLLQEKHEKTKREEMQNNIDEVGKKIAAFVKLYWFKPH